MYNTYIASVIDRSPPWMKAKESEFLKYRNDDQEILYVFIRSHELKPQESFPDHFFVRCGSVHPQTSSTNHACRQHLYHIRNISY